MILQCPEYTSLTKELLEIYETVILISLNYLFSGESKKSHDHYI